MFIPADNDLVSPDRVNGRAFILARRSALYLFLAAALALSSAAQVAQAAPIVKANNTNALNLTTSWVGGVVPGAADTAVWDSTIVGANSSAIGGSLSFLGIQGTNPGGAITISDTAAAILTLGTGGIDLSTATQNFTINPNMSAGGSQSWTVNGGRTLNLWVVNTSRGLGGAGNVSIQQSGAGVGTVNMLPGATGSVGFADAGGNASYTGNWTIGPNVLVTNIRNGSTGWGTGSITLAGGTIAPVQGNWTWTNGIALQTATTSTIDNKNTSGTNRFLKLQGVISGSGNLIFDDTGTGFTSADLGYIITGANTLGGTVTINAAAEVRLGGVPGSDTTTGAGTGGTLGTAAIVNNGSLTLSRSDAWTFANAVSGAGGLRIGGAVAGAGTQVVTVSGANSYNGDTMISTGTMKLGATGVIPDGAGKGNVNVGGTLDMNGFSETINGLSGAGVVDNTAAGTATLTAGANNATSIFSGSINNTGGALSLTKTGTGTLDLTGVSAYSGGTNIQNGILRVSGAGLIGGGPIAVSGGAELQVDTTSGLKTFAQNIGGTGLIHKTAVNNLVLQGINTFSGQHLVDAGFLVFDSIDAENGNPKLNLNGGNLALGAAFVGNSATISELQGSGQISPAFGAAAGTKTLLVNQTTNTIYSGSIIDASGGRLMALTKDGSGTLEITGANTNTGPTTILGGVLKVSGGAAATLGTGPISIASGTTLEYDTSGGVTAPGKLVASDISGTGLLLKSGANNLRLSGNNTFTGTHRVTGGYLVYVSSNAENGAPNLELNGGNMALPEIFNGLANAATIGNLSGTSAASQIDPNFNIVATPGTRFLSINQTVDAAFAGRIVAGTGSREVAVVKGGPNKLTFTNNNTYLGSTTVQGGTLQLDVGGRISGTSGVTVGNAIGSGSLLVTTTGSHSLGVGGVTLGTGATGATGTLNMQAAGGTTVSVTNDLVVGELGVGVVNHTTASTIDVGPGAPAGDLVIGQTGFAPVNRSTYNLTAGGSVLADNIYVGRNTPSSGQDHQLNISGAGATVTARTDLKVGFGGRGTVNQTGANSVVNVTGMTTFTVGDAGVGVYNLNASGGSVVDSGSAFIGTNGGNGTMNHDLGAVSIALGLTVGNTGSTGAYTMANNAANSLTVGGNELIGVGTGVGTFTQNGGTHRLTGATGSGDMTIGLSGQYNLAGGVLDFRDYVGTTPALAGAPWSPNNASTLSMPNPSQFSFTGGTLIDVSTINPNGALLQSGGSFIIGRDESPFLIPLTPTSAAALTTINGGYNQSGGAIYFDIFAPDPTSVDPFDPAQADFLDVKGNVTLNGTVNVSFLLANSSYPLFHQIWNVLAADVPGGTITRGPNFALNGAFYRISPTNNGGQVLQVFVPEPGTAAVWSLLALAAGCFAWRRRRNAG